MSLQSSQDPSRDPKPGLQSVDRNLPGDRDLPSKDDFDLTTTRFNREEGETPSEPNGPEQAGEQQPDKSLTTDRREPSQSNEKEPSNERKPSQKQQNRPPQQPPQRKGPGLLPIIGLGMLTLLGVRACSGDGTSAKETELRQELSPEDLASPLKGITNIFLGADQAIEAIKGGQLEPEVKELDNNLAGTLSYEFKVKDEVSGQKGKKIYLQNIAIGSDQHTKLYTALKENNFVVKSEAKVIETGQTSSPWVSIGSTVLLYGLLFGGMIYLMSRLRGGAGGAGGINTALNAKGEEFKGGEVPDRFSDLGGLDHVVEELNELKAKVNRAKLGDSRVKLPKGILFDGPPGVGKTKLARTLAGEADAPFIKFDCSELSTQLFVGTGAARVQNAFKRVRKLRDEETERLRGLEGATGKEEGVAFLFLDEFNSIGSKRTEGRMNFGGDSEHLKVVNTILNEMDGFDPLRNKNVVVIAATNDKEILDGALLRPGRFTRSIHIGNPRSAEQRMEILKVLQKSIVDGRGFTLENQEDLEYIAKITPSKSGDHLRQILQEATDIAELNDRTAVTKDDLFESAQRIDSGRLEKNYLPREKHALVARHEHGHALSAIGCGVELFLVSMLPRGDSAGRVIPDPQGLMEMLSTREDYLKRIFIGAGGRAAELATYGENGITPGASMDLEQIRGIVAHMISDGMIGDQYSTNLRRLPVSEWQPEHREMIDRIAKNAVDTAREMLEAIGEDKLTFLTDDSLNMGKELVGKDAQKFYLDRLGEDDLKTLARFAQRFVEKPEGQ